MGEGYRLQYEITVERITGDHGRVIRPRALKSRDVQSQRVRDMAEVFTPSKVCAKMVDYIDQDWHEANPGGSWRDYVLATVMEITCGEAPFLVSRYDAVSGLPIPLAERYGVLDRKLRVVGGEASDEEYLRWALLAVGSVYGYEWQGDNLVLAREAVVATFADYFRDRFGREPDEATLLRVAEIVAWNLWQMDGLKGVVPLSCHTTTSSDGDLFDPHIIERPCPGCEKNDILLHNGVKCKLRRWVETEVVMPDHFDMLYTDIICKTYKIHNKTKYRMKFDYIIGNPPYQEETKDTSDKPVYDKFMEGAYQVGEKVELITPARFLFNAGKTSRDFNVRMLNDEHLKVLRYEPDSSTLFNGVDIKGGIAITYRDSTADYGKIIHFTAYKELQSILRKVIAAKDFKSIDGIIYLQNKFNLEALYADCPQFEKVIGSDGRERRLTTPIFNQLEVFSEQKRSDDDLRILGLIGNKRHYRFIPAKYVESHENLLKYKVILPASNGSGAIGEVISTPIIGTPMTGYTQSFIGIGSFSGLAEAEAALKYVKSKFMRTMLGILKVTQHNHKDVWKYVPIQDFTPSSDIDWSGSVSGIDRQLYRKYGLSAEEVSFIESKVKPME